LEIRISFPSSGIEIMELVKNVSHITVKPVTTGISLSQAS